MIVSKSEDHMMIRMLLFASHFFFISLLFFLSVGCEGSFFPEYSFKKDGKEEGFRWRSFENSDQVFKDVHIEMSDIERHLSSFLKDPAKNLVVAKIGIVYKVNNHNSLKYMSDWIYNVDENEELTEQICVFQSGFSDNLINLKNFKHRKDKNLEKIFHYFYKKYFYNIYGDPLERENWIEKLKYIFEKEHNESNKIINTDLTNTRLDEILDEINDPRPIFNSLYAHSEQWLVNYLSINSNFISNLDNLISKITLQEENNKIEIKRIILHIHTNRDACDVCSQTISLFSRILRNYYINYTVTNVGYKYKNVFYTYKTVATPLIIVSSRTGYKERRFLVGHDGSHEKGISLKKMSLDYKGPAIHITLNDPPDPLVNNPSMKGKNLLEVR